MAASEVVGRLGAALGASEEGQQAEIEANVELVETLKAAADRNERHRKPTAVVLPIGSCADTDRWFDNVEWHQIRSGTRAFLGAPPDADYPSLVRAAYARFPHHAAAGVAYHF